MEKETNTESSSSDEGEEVLEVKTSSENAEKPKQRLPKRNIQRITLPLHIQSMNLIEGAFPHA